MNNNLKANSKYAKKAIVAGTMALAVLTGAGIWFTQPAQAADTTAAAQDRSAEQGSRGAGGHGPRGGGFGFGSDELQTQLQEWLSLDADTLKTVLKEKTLAEVAEEQGVSSEDLQSKLEAWLEENMTAHRQAKESSDDSSTGSSTDSQTAKTPDFADMAAKMLEGKGGFGMGHGRGGMMGGGMFGDNEKLADLLGLSTDELKAAIKEGSSLSAIAEKQNVDVDDVIDLLVSSMTEKLEAQLEEGKLTDEQYETRKTELENRVTQMVNGEHPEKPAKTEDQSE
jgi:DNA-directed RNA polymerase specialized sigma subunit